MKEKYIFLYQDVRGKFKSEGEWVLLNPYKAVKKGPKDVDESSDMYDTTEWLINNIPYNNGKVGEYGISYGGWQTPMGMIDACPALKASAPMASPGDIFLGDDFYHNGAFRLLYTFSWTSSNVRIRVNPTETRTKPFEWGTPDGYRYLLELGPVSNVNKKLFLD